MIPASWLESSQGLVELLGSQGTGWETVWEEEGQMFRFWLDDEFGVFVNLAVEVFTRQFHKLEAEVEVQAVDLEMRGTDRQTRLEAKEQLQQLREFVLFKERKDTEYLTLSCVFRSRARRLLGC